jgi:phosphoribosyl-ATP pyrophosphohydrolase/phosphoribosyl-AMP cyclohydrolase
MQIDFDKQGGLVPAIVQDAVTKQVLMLGYMNEEALRVTQERGLVTFYSRSQKKLWTKGETSDLMCSTVKDPFYCLIRVDPSTYIYYKVGLCHNLF